jgi:hypothetical protein
METWDKTELKNLAFASGKPLEVRCAEQFYQKGWHVKLGSFYRDIDGKLRELDALVEKNQEHNLNGHPCEITLRVLCSCKGFLPETRPVTYSVSENKNVALKPAFMYEGRTRLGAIMERMGEKTADLFIRREDLKDQLIGFDMFEKKTVKGTEEYRRKGDRDYIYEGLDSAIKAAIFWFQRDKHTYQQLKLQNYHRGYVTLSVPLLVTQHPFFDFTMDKGQPTDRVIRHSGYFVGYYPYREEEPEKIMSLIWHVEKLTDLIKHLDFLFDELETSVKLSLER